MKIIVFGAFGKVGQKVVSRLLAAGHEVTAFVYGGSKFDSHTKLKVVQGDVKDASAVRAAINGCDTVISVLGSWGTKTKDILSCGMANIVPAMQELGVTRIVSLTGADALLPGEKPTGIQYVTRPLFLVIAGKILRDGEQHMKILAESNLDWTVVRSPVMNERGSRKYRLTEHTSLPWQTIHRDAVAKSLVELCESGERSKEAPVISRVV